MENEDPSKNTAPDSPMLVIAIDELQELTEPRGRHDNAYSPFHLLGRAIKVFSESRSPGPDAWVVFLSTNSKVTHFAAPAVIHPSQRVLNEGQLIFPPFCLLQWDTFDEPKNVLSVGNYEDAISFGRPLWKSVNSLELYRKPEAMSKFALTKLINSDVNRINSAQMISDEMALAVLGQRFAIDFLFGAWEAVPFVDTSVASHMRVLTSTTEDRSWRYTTYPSEPVLSNAAAQFMYMEEQTVSRLSRTLVQNIVDGLVDAGEVGELMSRLLILISRDFAAILNYRIQIAGDSPKSRSPPLSQRFPSSHGDFFPYLRPVPLLDVLDILLGLEWLSECKEDIVSAFKRAYISASHWNVLSKDIGPLLNVTASDWLKSYFLCGVAVQCRHDQPLIDKVVPILFLNPAGQYDGMSCWLIQDKNKTKVDSRALRSIEVGHTSIDLDTGKPYVVTCFNFGVRGLSGEGKEDGTEEGKEEGKEDKTEGKKLKGCRVTMPSRGTHISRALRIEVTGLSEEVFPVLKTRYDFARSIIALLQATKTIQIPKDSTNQALVRVSLEYASSKPRAEKEAEISRLRSQTVAA
ncbi:hypothetical protein K435DRAFT_418125 [Dendrothele bispora CBS 962.96]|uniref:Uncharacterized protein n=1 Tax=Dendrothele bispora (strain CBS 962.96) TaxID=1314807 RepID=A0A4S8MUQ5_DENBC|nr:hypothetical protein K435DRAFT_418125 [Dendrothele bispora CBS 962.96]